LLANQREQGEQKKRVIIVVGGEKDVLNLETAGFFATTNPGGEGEWKAVADLSAFGGCDVVIIPDRDSAGQKWARAVWDSLQGIARSVHVLYLPYELTDKHGKDISDWLDEGHGNDLEALIEAEAVAERPTLPGATPSGRQAVGSHEDLSDKGNAALLAQLHGERIRYCPDLHHWLLRDERTGLWRPDRCNAIRRFADDVANVHYEALKHAAKDEQAALFRWARSTGNSPHIDGMLKEAGPRMPVYQHELDADPLLLGTPDGVLHLSDQTVRPAQFGEYVTKTTAASYCPHATSPEWDELLDLFVPAGDLRDDMQLAAGYCLSGRPKEHVFIVLSDTKRGKSTFVSALRNALGEYATACDISTFSKAYRAEASGHTREDLVALVGKRLVVASEVEGGLQLSASLLKQVTGNDPVSMRANYGKQFTALPTYGIWFLVNELPHLPPDDNAVWERVHVLKFPNYIAPEQRSEVKRDRAIDPAIVGSAVLRWLVEGWVRYQEAGRLILSGQAAAATAAYREETDHVRLFIAEACYTGDGQTCSFKALKMGYQTWARSTGVKNTYSDKRLGASLKRLGFEPYDGGVGGNERWYKGVGLSDEFTSFPRIGG